jgi:tetratricopeptide (TPR) repeat protein
MEKSPFNPEKAVKQGKKLFSQKKYLSAIEQFQFASDHFRSAKDWMMQAEMQNNLSVCHLMAGNAAAALKEAESTDKIFADGGDVRRQAMALGNQAAAQEALKHPDKALELYKKSNQFLKQVGDRELRAVVLKHISALQLKTGEKYQALASMNTALNEEPKPSVKEKWLKRLLGRIFRLN